MSHSCRSDVKCIICNKRHYAVLCSKLPLRSGLETESASVENSTTASSSSSVLANQACTSGVLLQTFVVVLQNGNHRSLVRALIDTGSQKSYILKSTAKKLAFKNEGEEFIHPLIGGNSEGSSFKRIFLSPFGVYHAHLEPDLRLLLKRLKLARCAYLLFDRFHDGVAWIQRTRDWGVFVFNRVKEIRNLSDVSSWEHVPSEKNFADIFSRGCASAAYLFKMGERGPLVVRKPGSMPEIKTSPDENAINLELRKSVLLYR
ncbi:hypothetical protein TNIN_90711 [Trichonephila inaurata madagascariensis]|uniref:Peptidase A2 domain-containing protein n=1 Tax=Trichonephila inaurata madagascariensis TaxID=2747483 RepID=A0A8X6WXV4_9ARAC|nr:hypothetical protein TNIN_90711 [Trichonephila inaurata madagascariensis]